MLTQSNNSPVLVLGRAIHAPWNEGGRVITRDIARSAAMVRPVDIVSLSRASYRDQPDDEFAIEQVYTSAKENMAGDYSSLPGLLRRVGELHRKQRYGTVHMFGLPLIVAAWLRSRGMRTVVHVTLTRQMYQGRLERLRYATAWRLFDRWIDAYACSSEQIRSALKQQGYKPEKLHLVSPPIDTQTFKPAARDEARRKLGYAPDDFVVAYVGTVSPLRFPAADILGALDKASASVRGLRLEVFAPVKTHAYNTTWADQNVRRAAEGASVPVQVHLQDLTEAEKTEVYTAADVVLLPFQAPVAVEPPLTLLEAMACQTPVLVTPFSNRSHIVRDWETGVTYESADELRAQLEDIYARGPEQRAELGHAERSDVVQHFSFAAAARALQKVWSAIGDRYGQSS